MKWQERSNWRRHRYFTGPENTYYTARAGGVSYEVNAAWECPLSGNGEVLWWSHNGTGTNKCWPTKEAAMAWCEQDAEQRKADKRKTRPTTPTPDEGESA